MYRLRHFVVLFPILLISTTIVYLHLPHSSNNSLIDSVRQQYSKKAQSRFITSSIVEPPFNPHPIRLLCSEKKWIPGLIFTCNNPIGGIGNLRVSILTCVRFAIEAGAALVMPNIIVRNSEDVGQIRTGKHRPLSHVFNAEHLTRSLQRSCPQLKLYQNILDVPNYNNAKAPLPLLPEDLPTPATQLPQTGLENPEKWRGYFEKWMFGQSSSAALNPNLTVQPEIVDLQRSYLQFPVYYDGPDFVSSFGQLLQFRSDARHVAGAVLYAMMQKFDLKIPDPSQPYYKNAFLGAHLRTEQDSQVWSGWNLGAFPDQAATYINHAAKCNMSLIYIASGDQREIAKFAVLAQQRLGNISVVTKFGLLEETGLDEYRQLLNSLTWDQQAEVDYLVMLKASQFVGVGHSSFAWNVALKRRMLAGLTGPFLDGPQMLSDNLSQIMGKIKEYPMYAACMWP
jgi:hypothetical protein